METKGYVEEFSVQTFWNVKDKLEVVSRENVDIQIPDIWQEPREHQNNL